jgi:hypothetical protein
MSSTVWALGPAQIWGRETHIFRFLRDAKCEVRVVEVRLFRTSQLSERVPMDTRRSADLREPPALRDLAVSRGGPRIRTETETGSAPAVDERPGAVL